MGNNSSAKGGSASGGKKILILIVVLVIVGLGFYFYNKNTVKAPTVESNAPVKATSTAAPAPAPSPAAQAGGGETPGSNIQVWEVDFNGTAFTPATININAGDWVFFKNKSTINFWPTSAGFDAGAAVAPGKEFKFQFTRPGTFGYSDRLNPATKGAVVVQ